MSVSPEVAGSASPGDAASPVERLVDQLAKVRFLAEVDRETLGELCSAARRRTFRAGARIVGELEFGADVFVLTAGEAEISIDGSGRERLVLGKLGPGGAFGEMSSLTGQLRSATVRALGPVEVLVIADRDFDRLRERRPAVSVALLRILSERLAETERSIDELLAAEAARVPATVHPRLAGRRGSIRNAFRELVVNRGHDLAFLTLVAFVATLVAVRLAVYLAFHFDLAPRDVLRAAYLSGFLLLGGSSGASLLVFRPVVRRGIAIAYGVGLALIFNELGVTLAFDIFYKDIHTPDPNVAFDVERLYRRTEPLRAIVIGLVVLFQAAYLRPFYRRVLFVLKTRLRKRLR